MQEFVEAADRMAGDAGEDIGQATAADPARRLLVARASEVLRAGASSIAVISDLLKFSRIDYRTKQFLAQIEERELRA